MMPSCSATAPCLPSSSGRCCLIQHLILLDQANVPIRKAPTSKPCSSRSRKVSSTVANCAPFWSNILCSCSNWASVPCSTAICPTALTCSAPCEVERWLREKQRTLDHHHLQDLFHATVHALQEEIPGLGEVVAIDVKHQYAWVRENNLRESITDRFCKERQPRGDPDCRVGVKSSTNQEQPNGSTKERKEYLWGYGSGIATAITPDYGDVVLADFTQPFNESDVSYYLPLFLQAVAVLGRFPLHVTADAAYDAWYVYQTCAHREGIAAIPLNTHGHEDVPRDRDSVPLCPIGLRMHPTYRFLHTKGYHAQRYRCPLLFPERTGQTCAHEQFQKDKGCVKDINIEKGGLMRAMLDRSSPLYRAVYRQRTSAERINSQAKARGIERPKVRQGDAVRRLNTLTYILINLKALARARAINASLLTPKLGKLT